MAGDFDDAGHAGRGVPFDVAVEEPVARIGGLPEEHHAALGRDVHRVFAGRVDQVQVVRFAEHVKIVAVQVEWMVHAGGVVEQEAEPFVLGRGNRGGVRVHLVVDVPGVGLHRAAHPQHDFAGDADRVSPVPAIAGRRERRDRRPQVTGWRGGSVCGAGASG